MAYTNLTDVKEYLQPEGTSYDSEISQLVCDVDAELNRILDIDGFGSGTATESIDLKYVHIYNGVALVLYLKNFNVLSITHINWSAYSGVLGTDYKIHGRKVMIKDYSSYISDLDFGLLDITYTYGYEAIPANVSLLAKLMVAVKFRQANPWYMKSSGQANMAGVTEYQLADERIKYGNQSMNWQSIDELNMKDEATIKRLLASYKKGYVL